MLFSKESTDGELNQHRLSIGATYYIHPHAVVNKVLSFTDGPRMREKANTTLSSNSLTRQALRNLINLKDLGAFDSLKRASQIFQKSVELASLALPLSGIPLSKRSRP